MFRKSVWASVGLLAFSCASPPVKTALGDIDSSVPEKAKMVISKLNEMDANQHLVYHKNYWPDQREDAWLKRRFYAVNALLNANDLSLLSLFMTAEQKVTHKAIFSRPNEPLKRTLYNEPINSGAPPGTYVYYYDPRAEYHDTFDYKKKKDFFEAKPWQRFHGMPLSYVVIPKAESHKDLFKGIYHAFTDEAHRRAGFDTDRPINEPQSAIEITRIESPGVLEGYGFLQPKTGREFLLYSTENEIILIRVNSNQSRQKWDDRFSAHYAIKAGLSGQLAIVTAASKPLKKCDTAFDRKRCEEAQLAEAQRQQEADRKRAEEIRWEEWWERHNRSTPKFCSTMYGTPKDGLMTTTTTCK